MWMTSDHAPLLISVSPKVPFNSRFIFQRMWMDHPEFQNIVAQVWAEETTGSPSYRVAAKLRRLKVKLKTWNWGTFGDLNAKIIHLQAAISELEVRVQNSGSPEDDHTLNQYSSELRQVLAWDAELRFQKTRAKWLQDGDRNTKFFHAVIRERRRLNTITIHDTNGEITRDPKAISQQAALFFEALFKASPFIMHEELFENYPSLVTEEMNDKLSEIPSAQEIWDSVYQLSADSAPGVDGFTGHFFRGCWQTIQADMVEMILGFFKGDYLHHDIMATSLTLIPKVDKPRNIVDYRPISL